MTWGSLELGGQTLDGARFIAHREASGEVGWVKSWAIGEVGGSELAAAPGDGVWAGGAVTDAGVEGLELASNLAAQRSTQVVFDGEGARLELLDDDAELVWALPLSDDWGNIKAAPRSDGEWLPSVWSSPTSRRGESQGDAVLSLDGGFLLEMGL